MAQRPININRIRINESRPVLQVYIPIDPIVWREPEMKSEEKIEKSERGVVVIDFYI